MKHLEVRQKYSAARRIFNSLVGVSSGDETLRLMLDILLIALSTLSLEVSLAVKPRGNFLILGGRRYWKVLHLRR